MKISIIAPVYNVADKIERCAVSLFEQTHKDMEYIFVDDCTPDNSIEVLTAVVTRYPERKKQVRILHHEKNKGQSAARNLALDTTSGEFVMFVDSDDYLPLDACATLLRQMQEEGADVAIGAFSRVLGNGKEIVERIPKMSKEQYLRRLLCINIIPHCFAAKLYQRRLFDGFRWTEGVNLQEDHMMNAIIGYKASKLCFVNEIVYYYDCTEFHDYKRLYNNHLSQMARSSLAVAKFYEETEDKRRYHSCIQIGLLDICRHIARHQTVPSEFEEVKRLYDPWARFLSKIILNKQTSTAGTFIYKALRRLFLFFNY